MIGVWAKVERIEMEIKDGFEIHLFLSFLQTGTRTRNTVDASDRDGS